ncbi:MAG TPA: MATE family efflux transporter [Candidatus Fusicatenibacter merdavium]|uniref:Multidrug export protein MepA n=1 Tax=Candidatus Fusicatenibacter merdavium TaxID=2838600 RepID=A0A9D1XC03_9FIRM|nr:MATE family efflux transporter [Candidatus Fusicatenibacter merdavium]
MQVHQTDFSTGSVRKNILDVALPMTAAQLLNLLYNIVDRVYIGMIPDVGQVALGGLGLCFPIIMMVTAFTNLFGGASPLCGIARGAGNEKEAENIMGNAFVLLVLSGVILMTIGLVFHKPILYLFGASDVTYRYAAEYIMIYLLGTVPVMIALGMNPYINSQGFPRIGMLTVFLGAVVNIVLDPIFIFVFDMGVSGAATATIISQFLSAVWVLKFLTGKQAALRLKRESMKLSAVRVKNITGLGLSSFVMSFTNSLVQVACNSTLQQFGGDLYISIMTILNSIREIAQTPVNGLTSGSSPVLSFNYGEKQYKKVRQGIWFAAAVCIVYTLIIWGLIFLFPRVFIGIFNRDPELMTDAVPAMHVYFFGFFMMALQFAGQNAFTALGKAKFAVFFSLLRKVVIVVPLTLLLPRIGGLGVMGVFLAEPISNFIGGTACFVTMLCTVMPELRRGGKA